ncbi:MAG: glycosyltransferase [Verrucomicrobiota bacterium]
MIDELIENARANFDLTEAAHQDSVRELSERFQAVEDTEGLRGRLSLEGTPLEARMAGLLAESRRWLAGNERPLRVAVVFAMWGEHRRMRPKDEGNPHGEDSLSVKLEQLEWATRDSAVEWMLYAVDDGCPHGSALIAREIAGKHALGDRLKVLSLSEVLPAASGPLAGLGSADESRKAGAIILGAMEAIGDGVDVVIYTDADNSVHLGQVGLLLRTYVEESAPVVLGNRKHAESVLVKEAARWGIGIKVLRHMQRMIGEAVFSRGILDTQAAFKLYEADLLKRIIAEPTVYDFSFDTDWILAAIREGVPIEQVPFAFIDSAAESASIAQGPMTTWETLLFGLTKAVKRHGYCEGDAAAMASVLEEEISGHEDLDALIDYLPRQLETAGEMDYGNAEVMGPEALRKWIRERLKERGT